MKIETREIYKCDFCRKLYQVKTACEKHELYCNSNPDNKTICHDCEHCNVRTVTVPLGYGDMNGNEVEGERALFHCNKLDEYLLPLKAQRKGNAYQTNESNNPMRKECEFFKKKKEDW